MMLEAVAVVTALFLFVVLDFIQDPLMYRMGFIKHFLFVVEHHSSYHPTHAISSGPSLIDLDLTAHPLWDKEGCLNVEDISKLVDWESVKQTRPVLYPNLKFVIEAVGANPQHFYLDTVDTILVENAGKKVMSMTVGDKGMNSCLYIDLFNVNRSIVRMTVIAKWIIAFTITLGVYELF